MTPSPIKEYFDSIADQWDGWMDMETINQRIEDGLRHFGVEAHEQVLDAGCGTGNLTKKLLERLTESGRVTAVDVSPRMVELARKKNDDPRANAKVADLKDLPLENNQLDRVFCFSMWPHVAEPEMALQEIKRVLKPGGLLHIWHIDSRQKINEVHANAGEAVHKDILIPASDLAELVRQTGFDIEEVRDSDSDYLITAEKER